MGYNTSMKILFLDIDGVLNSVTYSKKVVRRSLLADPTSLDPAAGKMLGDWLKQNLDVGVVISSTWRKIYSIDELKEILSVVGIPAERILEYTPVIHNTIRGEEIKAWIQGQMFKSNFPITGIAILDDDADMGKLGSYLVQTDVEVGLTEEDLLRTSNLFKAPMPNNIHE